MAKHSPIPNMGAELFSDSENRGGRKERRISLTSRFPIFLLIWFLALFFTQALRSHASTLFLAFVTLLPIGLCLYTLTAIGALQLDIPSESATVEKGAPYTYRIRLFNLMLFPYPFIEARMILPQSNSVRCRERSVFLSMNPFGTYEITNEVSFRFRGTYQIGVRCLYVYDFFRIFRVRVDLSGDTSVSVLPRKLFLSESDANASSDAPDHTRRSAITFDRLEVDDIRAYRIGDPLKSIHWNLSSRQEEELIVKDYNTGASKMTYIYCDLSARFPEDPPPVSVETKREIKKRKQLEQERAKAKKKAAKILSNPKKKNKLSPEELELLPLTKRERKERLLEINANARRENALMRLRTLSKKDPKKAAALREMIYESDRRREEAKSAEAERQKRIAEMTEIDLGALREPQFYEDMNEYCADGVIELTVATVLREFRRGATVVLSWYDDRAVAGLFSYTLSGSADFAMIYRLFATAPLARRDQEVVRLSSLCEDNSGIKQIFVTSSIDKETVTAFCSMPMASEGDSFGSSEILLYQPEERFLYPKERRSYMEGCMGELSGKGFRLSIGHPEVIPEAKGGVKNA